MDINEAKFNTEISNYIFSLLDRDDTFEDFNTDQFAEISEQDVASSNEFFNMCKNSNDYCFMLFSVWACILMKVLCDDYNEKYAVNVQLTDLGCFNEYFVFLINTAKKVSKEFDVDIKNCIYYTFITANKNFSDIMQKKNKRTLTKYLKKHLFKPIMKLFVEDYKSIYKIKRIYGD